MSNNTFRAFVVEHKDDTAERAVAEFTVDQLGVGDVVIRVDWSGVNFKDGLASTHKGNVARLTTLIPGIDLAGTVVESESAAYKPGDQVLVHGYDLGVAHHGGFSEMARVPSEWIVPLPEGLSCRDVMSLGTAGFTAALSVVKLEGHGLTPGSGPVLVTGATGGVGSVAVGILAAKGYEVVAATGKESAKPWLTELGATDIITRDDAYGNGKPLQKERWAGAVDCVGGDILANTVSSLRYGAAVAASGNTGGVKVPTTVFPFILRGVALLGVDSVQCDIATRTAIWNRLATDLRPVGLDRLGSSEVTLDELTTALDTILAGGNLGRTLVKLAT